MSHAVRNKTSNLLTTVFQGKTEMQKRSLTLNIIYGQLSKVSSLNLREMVIISQKSDEWRTFASLNSEAECQNDEADR